MTSNRATLIKPPPTSDDRAPIEDVLELTHLADIDPNLFTNTRPLWHPPGARGIYGGAVIAQCLAAAQRTVPGDFAVHSMHCYFVLNGNSEIPVVYHVEHVREGRSFATRTVQARQRGQPIFTTTLSFTREGSGGPRTIEHAALMRRDARVPRDDDPVVRAAAADTAASAKGKSPFLSRHIDVANAVEDVEVAAAAAAAGIDLEAYRKSSSSSSSSGGGGGATAAGDGRGAAAAAGEQRPDRKRTLQWIRARGRISDQGGYQAHLSALAYMSDSYFIGTVSRVHGLDHPRHQARAQLTEAEKAKGQISMMVSLDHTIYFHNPRDFRADEWMFTEMETPWAGDGRGLVFQRIFTKSGKLIASCVQEGVVRLQQDNPKL